MIPDFLHFDIVIGTGSYDVCRTGTYYCIGFNYPANDQVRIKFLPWCENIVRCEEHWVARGPAVAYYLSKSLDEVFGREYRWVVDQLLNGASEVRVPSYVPSPIARERKDHWHGVLR